MSTSSQALVACHSSIQHHSKSFALAARLLPHNSRDAAAIVYAWCRRADDAVDEVPLPQAKLALERLHHELSQLYAGEVQHDPVLAAFQGVVQLHAVPEAYPRQLLQGMAMDVADTEYRSLDDLLRYCYHVASTVGLMLCHVLGVRSPAALPHAVHLGIGMQLTNVCRDVLEDWQRGRLYLPDTLLAAHGAAHLRRELGKPLGQQHRAALAGVLQDLLRVAGDYYRSADRGLPYLAPRSAFAISAARRIYSQIGNRIARQNFDVFAGRAVVPTYQKLWLVCQAAGTSYRLARSTRLPFTPSPLAELPYAPSLFAC